MWRNRWISLLHLTVKIISIKDFLSPNAERGNSGERHVLHIQTVHVDFHYISLFCTTGLFPCLLKTSKTYGFGFRGYRKWSVACNGLVEKKF